MDLANLVDLTGADNSMPAAALVVYDLLEEMKTEDQDAHVHHNPRKQPAMPAAALVPSSNHHVVAAAAFAPPPRSSARPQKRKVQFGDDATTTGASSSSSRPRKANGRSSNSRSSSHKESVSAVEATILKCTACDLNNDAEYVHPVLNLPVCGRCNKMYHDAHFSVDSETGNCWECVMCGVGDGNWMFMCDDCPKSFCQRCVTFSVGPKEAARVRALQTWSCYSCAPTPSFERLIVPKDFSFFNIESLYSSVRPPAEKDASGAYKRGDRWSKPICDSIAPMQLVRTLSRGEKCVASLFSSQMTSGVMPMLRISDRFLGARDLAVLRRLSKRMRVFFRSVILSPGLFQTPFGEENRCMLHPHQNVSLRWMTQAENQTEEFGALRGGVLADAPGLGKTVTMIALIASTAGQLPIEPSAFWDTNALETVWNNNGGSSEGNYRCVEGALRNMIKQSDLTFFPRILTAEYTRTRFQAGEFPTLTSFEQAIRSSIRHVVADGDPRHAEMLRHSFRRNMLTAKASMDKRSRASFQSASGARMLLERSLHPSAATLIIVPMALLEHWFEQIKRHLSLDFLAHKVATPSELKDAMENGWNEVSTQGVDDEDTLAGRRGVVYFDGLGDILDVSAPLPRLRVGGDRKSALELSQYLIVVTTFERCASLQQQVASQREVNRYLSQRSVSATVSSSTAMELSQVRWLRLVVDEGHELGAQSATSKGPDDATPTTAFIRDLAAERRWVMSGTPTTGTKSSLALAQIQKLLVFLRHKEWGVGVDAQASWMRLVAQPFLRQEPTAREILKICLGQIMIRHTKQDLDLYEPIRHTVVLDAEEERLNLDALMILELKEGGHQDENDDDNEVDKLKAKYIYSTIKTAKAQWDKAMQTQRRLSGSCESSSHHKRGERALRRPKAIVFSTDRDHLAGVGHFLYLWMGDRNVCEHSGTQDSHIGAQARNYMSEMRSAELSRFRTSMRKLKNCPLCGGENFITGGHSCTKTLLLIEYDEEVQIAHDILPPNLVQILEDDDEESEIEEARKESAAGANMPAASAPKPARGGHGASGRGSFYKGECLCSPLGCKEEGRPKGYCSLLPNPFSKKPGVHRYSAERFTDGEIQGHSLGNNPPRSGANLALVAEEHIRHWVPGRRFHPGEEVHVLPSPAYEDEDIFEGAASAASHVPLLWRQGRLGGTARVRAWKRCGKGSGHGGWHAGKHILGRASWTVDHEEASVLLLQEDGSTGLDLSFATHIFLLDQLRDPALESQIISRAHRMGAKGPVDVTLLLANEVEEKSLQAATAAAVSASKAEAKN